MWGDWRRHVGLRPVVSASEEVLNSTSDHSCVTQSISLDKALRQLGRDAKVISNAAFPLSRRLFLYWEKNENKNKTKKPQKNKS